MLIGVHGIDLKMPVFIGLQADFWHKERIHPNYAPG